MAGNDTESNCVVGVVIREGMVLLVHRASWLRVLPSAWGLFGGHVEGGESLEEAVRREAREELGIVPLTLRRLGQLDNPGEPGVVHVYAVLTWESEPENAAPEEHTEIRWFSAVELPESAALDAYRPFVAAATQISGAQATGWAL